MEQQPDGTTRLCDVLMGRFAIAGPCPGVVAEGLQRTEGFVRVTGTIADEVLTVQTQLPAQSPVTPDAPLKVPCPAPPGGWPDGGGPYDDRGPDDAASIRFTERNPELAGRFLLLRPAADRIVAGALARDESEAATLRAELERDFPGRVCVVVTDEPVELVEQARRDLDAIDRPVPNTSGIRWDDGLRRVLEVRDLQVLPALEKLRDAYPPGLVQLRSFLEPAPTS